MSNQWYYTSRGKTSEVFIDPTKGYVVKQFRGHDDQRRNHKIIESRGNLEHSYLRELECLRRLKGQPNFPQLIDHDDHELWIKMSYCGTPYPCVAPRRVRYDLIDQANRIVDTLARVDIKYNYKCVYRTKLLSYEHLRAGNINLLGDMMFLLDFELSLPVGSPCAKSFDVKFVDQFKTGYTTDEFKKLFKTFLVPPNTQIDDFAFNQFGNRYHVKRNIRHQ